MKTRACSAELPRQVRLVGSNSPGRQGRDPTEPSLPGLPRLACRACPVGGTEPTRSATQSLPGQRAGHATPNLPTCRTCGGACRMCRICCGGVCRTLPDLPRRACRADSAGSAPPGRHRASAPLGPSPCRLCWLRGSAQSPPRRLHRAPPRSPRLRRFARLGRGPAGPAALSPGPAGSAGSARPRGLRRSARLGNPPPPLLASGGLARWRALPFLGQRLDHRFGLAEYRIGL